MVFVRVLVNLIQVQIKIIPSSSFIFPIIFVPIGSVVVLLLMISHIIFTVIVIIQIVVRGSNLKCLFELSVSFLLLLIRPLFLVFELSLERICDILEGKRLTFRFASEYTRRSQCCSKRTLGASVAILAIALRLLAWPLLFPRAFPNPRKAQAQASF